MFLKSQFSLKKHKAHPGFRESELWQVTLHVWQEADPKFRDTQERSQELRRQKRGGGEVLVRSRNLNQRVSHRECSGLRWAGVGPRTTKESR